jgi:hypothetical protein
MADRYLIETSAIDGYLLEDGTGVLLLEVAVPTSQPIDVMSLGQMPAILAQ